jgi:hypothetical protein
MPLIRSTSPSFKTSSTIRSSRPSGRAEIGNEFNGSRISGLLMRLDSGELQLFTMVARVSSRNRRLTSPRFASLKAECSHYAGFEKLALDIEKRNRHKSVVNLLDTSVGPCASSTANRQLLKGCERIRIAACSE